MPSTQDGTLLVTGCPCRAGHTLTGRLAHVVAELLYQGRTLMPVATIDGAWMVPVVYVAIHGIAPSEPTADLAGFYGWDPVPPPP